MKEKEKKRNVVILLDMRSVALDRDLVSRTHCGGIYNLSHL